MRLAEAFVGASALLICLTLQGCGSSEPATPTPTTSTTVTTTTMAVRCTHVTPKTASDPCYRQCNQSAQCTKSACANLGDIGCDGTRCEREGVGATAHCTSQFTPSGPQPIPPFPVEGAAYLTGFYVDMSLYQPGSYAGFRIISDKTCDIVPLPDSKSIVMGTNDGIHWWTVKGTVGQSAEDQKSGKASIDFTALDGPDGILGVTYNSTGILLERGQFWTRYEKLPFNFTDAHSGTSQDITGIWIDANRFISSKRTLIQARVISQDTAGTLGGSLVVVGSITGVDNEWWHCSANFTDKQRGLLTFEYYKTANFTGNLITFYGTISFTPWNRRVPEKPATLVVAV